SGRRQAIFGTPPLLMLRAIALALRAAASLMASWPAPPHFVAVVVLLMPEVLAQRRDHLPNREHSFRPDLPRHRIRSVGRQIHRVPGMEEEIRGDQKGQWSEIHFDRLNAFRMPKREKHRADNHKPARSDEHDLSV